MDYEKEYNEALERAKKRYYAPNADKIPTYANRVIEEIFPGLGESEDEKIRKWLLDTITQIPNDSIEWDVIEKAKVLSWLEKQGEKKATDKVEPKFHEGDWIIDKQGIVHQIEKVIENVTNNTFAYDLVGGGYFNEEVKSSRLWTIDDAKDGDVLVDVYGNIGIFQKNDDFDWSSYCSLGPNGGFRCFAIEHELDGSHPATKEQRDLLFKKIEEAGYQWDAKKKELKLLISNGGDFESNNSKQKPTWSEEDEIGFNDTFWAIQQARTIAKDENDMGNLWYAEDWLKSLKERLS